jgi:type II secretory ATPase GspE/PulE/Tfp pilus assembly ATPase PilB-like protein
MGSKPATQFEGGRKRLIASLKGTTLEQLQQKVTRDLAGLLGAASVLMYLRDPLTGELYARVPQGKKVRELRVPPEPSSAVGYAAMTLQKAFAWKRETDAVRRYVVALPLLVEGDPVAVLELTHGTANAPIDDERLKGFVEVAGHVGRRLEDLQQGTVQRGPYDGLLRAGKLTRAALKKAREEAAAEGVSVERRLLEAYGVDRAALGQSLADHFGTPFASAPGELRVEPDLLRRFSPEFLRAHAVLPVGWKGGRAEVVVANPHNLNLVDDIGRRLGTELVSLSVAVREDILAALDRLLGEAAAPAPAAAAAPAEDAEWEAVAVDDPGFDLGAGAAATIDSKTIRLVNETIQAATDRGASDIHFETTGAGGMAIRFRVDGICHDYRTVREACSRPVISRLKIMAQLNIAEHRLPQDGKIRLKDKAGRKIDLRVAIMPTFGGHEDAVLRLLPEYQALTLDQLGMEPDVLERFRAALGQPHGIVLCVGPTGSGKTTTLHAGLAALKGPEVKVWTAEDPVEIVQDGVRQVQVHAQVGLTFDRALRAFLRCDPDVIMIGEIRDRETAGAAIEASLTGHLVLSTLHTNSAAETVTRLLEMGLDPFTFGSSLLGVLAQRLVRKACERCAERGAPSAEEWQELRLRFGSAERFDALKVDRRRVTLSRARGCEACFGTGYKGRMGIHEMLPVTPALRRLVQSRAQADAIAAEGAAAGMLTLRQDGVRKVLQGRTDLREVLSNTASEL